MMELSTLYHSGPVTALCCHGNTVLAGIGSRLYTYDITAGTQTNVIKVLHGRNIHGIKKESHESKTRLCVYGQKSMRLLEYDSLSSSFKFLTDLIEISDWIWDVTWIQGTNQLYIILGHNVAVLYNLDVNNIVRSVHCQEKCILYCAKFLTCMSDLVVLATGTVFNQVVLWSPLSATNTDGRVDAFHRLAGHQGVIFSVDYDTVSQRICSVSDDRSIRLYQICYPTSDTGKVQCLQDWERMESHVIHVLYGHAARVWDVRLLSNVLVSVGEDSTCCIWSYDGHVIDKFKGHKGKSIWSLAVDKGEKHVVTGGGDHSIRLWKLKQLGKGGNSECVETDLDLELEESDFPRNTMMLDHDRALVMTNMGKLQMYNCQTNQCTCIMSDVAFMSYTVMSVCCPGDMVAIGNKEGKLRLLALHDKEGAMQIKTHDKDIYQSKIFSIHWLNQTSLLTTGPDGVINIWIVTNTSETLDLTMTQDVLDLPMSKHRWVSTATLTLDGGHLVCGDRSGSVLVYRLTSESQRSELTQSFPKIHGKAGVTSVCCHGNQVYTTGRDGQYRVYAWQEEGSIKLLNSNRVYKGYEWLEKIVFTSDGDLQIHGFHTDLYIVWSVRENQKLLQLECGGGHRAWDYSCHNNHTRFVYVKARQVKVKDVTTGSNQVILKESLHGREVCDAKLLCSYRNSQGEMSDVIVTCSEDTTICLSKLSYQNGHVQLNVLQTLTGHISNVKCLSVCDIQTKEPVDRTDCEPVHRKLIFSAGGRAQLKIWRVQTKFGTTINKTESSCKKSKTKSDNIPLTTNSANFTNKTDCNYEIKNDLHIHQLNPQDADKLNRENQSNIHGNNTNGTECECSVECLAGLQLGQPSRRRKKPWQQPVLQSDSEDSEARIMDLSSWRATDLDWEMPRSLFFVSAACSDGEVRLLAFDENLKQTTYLTSLSSDHCVIKTDHVIVRNDHMTESCYTSSKEDHVMSINRSKTHILVLSAATDGSVAFWEVTHVCTEFVNKHYRDCDKLGAYKSVDKFRTDKFDNSKTSPILRVPLHQSGINSLCCQRITDGRYILVTGGDDNALHVTFVTMETMDQKVIVKVTSQGGHSSVHSAQITGVAYISGFILSTSIDQRLCIWQIQKDLDILKLKMVGCKFVSVSDIANMNTWSLNRDSHTIMICGDGLEIIKLDHGLSDTACI